MKKSYLLLFLILFCFNQVNAQSGLYQTGSQVVLDDNFELFDKHLFSASRLEYEYLKYGDYEGDQQVSINFYHAVSALKIGNPGAPDLINHFIRSYPEHPRKSEAAYVLGNFYFDNKNYRESIPAFKKIDHATFRPNQKSEVYFKSGYAYFQLKDFKNALNYFNQVKTEKGEYSADAYYYAGFIAKEAGNYEQATQDFKQAEKASFYAPKVPYMLASIYYQQAKYEELIAYAEPVLKSRPNLDRKEEIHLFLAEAYFEKRNFAAAAQQYDLFVNAKKRDLDRSQVYKAGVAQFEIGNYQRASDYFKVSAVIEDEIGQVSSYYLGHAYLNLNNPQFASTSFNAAFKNNSNPKIKEDALVNFAKVNLQRGSFQEAVNALDTYLENYPNGMYAKEAEGLLTDALINTNNYLRAIDHIEKMSRKSERIREAYQKITFYQGVVYYRDKKHDLATTYFDKSLAAPVDKDLAIQTHFWKGENFAASGRTPQAIKSYETLQSLKPRSSDPYLLKSYYGLGYTYFNIQQYSKAQSQFRNYVEQGGRNDDPDKYDEALMRLGDVYFVQKNFENAQATFQKAISEGGSAVDYAYFRSGVVYNFQGRNMEAINQLERLLTTYPNSVYFEDALYQKSQINMELSQYEDAREGYSRLIAARPNSQFVPFALEGRAVANFSLQQYDQTIEDYKSILENHPNSSNAEASLVGLQEALALQGRSGEFSRYLSSFRNVNPDNKSVQNLEYQAAKNLYFSNSYGESITALNGYLNNYPQSANRDEGLYFLGDSYFKNGNTEKALETFYLLEKEKTSTQRSKAVQRIAALELSQKNYSKSIPYFRESINFSRNKLEEFEVFSGLMNAYYQTQKFDSAIFYSDKVILLGAVTQDGIPESMLLKAKSQLKLNKNTEAEATLMDLVNDYKSVQGAEGLYLLAENQAKKQAFEQSNNTIFDFSGPFFPYDYWYGRSFLLLADNYKSINEVFQAKATLESILENSKNEEIKKIAREKLAEIK